MSAGGVAEGRDTCFVLKWIGEPAILFIAHEFIAAKDENTMQYMWDEVLCRQNILLNEICNVFLYWSLEITGNTNGLS